MPSPQQPQAATAKPEVKVLIEPAEPQPSGAWPFIRRYILAPLPILVLVVVAGVLVVLGFENIQVGGLIGKLLGRKEAGKKAIDVANTIPEDRVDDEGNLIPIGEVDSKGITQAQVVPIQAPGLFDDPTKVKIKPAGEEKAIEVDLPDGVKAKDVEHVVVVTPEITAVTVMSGSAVPASDVDDLLSKYGNL